MYLIGYDIGSSTIKAALVRADTHEVVGLTNYPQQEMDMISRQRGWAEQQPEAWWQHFCTVTQRLLFQTGARPKEIRGIGIGYQMHGLVLVDKNLQALRPAIIWCDSRGVAIGQQAFTEMGEEFCLEELLNSPGNFTASKLKWVKDNEPEVYEKTYKILLPGDFIAMKLTGVAATTIAGLTEGIFWNFKEKKIAASLLQHLGLHQELLADTVPTFSLQGQVTKEAAERTGLAIGTPVTYRAGDQPNNALSLNVLHPGQVSATSGTSGVVYGIVDRPVYDEKSRVNSFAHVNYEQSFNRIGILLCLNGAGNEYSWIKHQIARGEHTYHDMERMASTVAVGSDGLCLLPFGNGAERVLENRNVNAHILNLDFNRHTRAHLYRASLEGVAFSFVYGFHILKELGLNADVIRVVNDDMFQSKIFSMTIATMLNCQIEVIETTGAVGAARAAGVAAGAYKTLEEALQGVQAGVVHEPNLNLALCQQAYSYWHSRLQMSLEERLGRRNLVDPASSQKADKLQKEIRQRNKELAASKLELNVMHDFLAEVKNALQVVAHSPQSAQAQPQLSRVLQKIESRLGNSEAWSQFEEHFDLMQKNFFKRLKAINPTLSFVDLKMCAYLKLNMSTKEMAQHLNLSVRGAETCRLRLRKKLGLTEGQNFLAFLEAI